MGLLPGSFVSPSQSVPELFAGAPSPRCPPGSPCAAGRWPLESGRGRGSAPRVHVLRDCFREPRQCPDCLVFLLLPRVQRSLLPAGHRAGGGHAGEQPRVPASAEGCGEAHHPGGGDPPHTGRHPDTQPRLGRDLHPVRGPAPDPTLSGATLGGRGLPVSEISRASWLGVGTWLDNRRSLPLRQRRQP